MTVQIFDKVIDDLETLFKTPGDADEDGLLPLISTIFHSPRTTDAQKHRFNALCTDFIFNCLDETMQKLSSDADDCPSPKLACNIMKIIFVKDNIPFLPPKTREYLENVTLEFYLAMARNKIDYSNMRDYQPADVLNTAFKSLENFLRAPHSPPAASPAPDSDPSKIKVSGSRKIIFNEEAASQDAQTTQDGPQQPVLPSMPQPDTSTP